MKPSQVRMRRRSGWPAKRIPNRSKVSRSRQFAAMNTAGDRRDVLALADAALDPDAVVLRERVEVVDDVEAGLAVPPVDGGDVHAVLEVFGVLQVPRDARDPSRGDDDGDLAGELLGRHDRVRDAAARIDRTQGWPRGARPAAGRGFFRPRLEPSGVVRANQARLADDVHPVDLLLQGHDAVDEGFGPRRAAGHVDVDRHDAVDALGHGVGCRGRRRSRRSPSR